jgi:hypothetical protein
MPDTTKDITKAATAYCWEHGLNLIPHESGPSLSQVIEDHREAYETKHSQCDLTLYRKSEWWLTEDK